MTTHNVSGLDGPLLCLAVAIADGREWRWLDNPFSISPGNARLLQVFIPQEGRHDPYWTLFNPAREWEDGGPIIQRERISIIDDSENGHWRGIASIGMDGAGCPELVEGPTALVAAMRAYVAVKFGETVELP